MSEFCIVMFSEFLTTILLFSMAEEAKLVIVPFSEFSIIIPQSTLPTESSIVVSSIKF